MPRILIIGGTGVLGTAAATHFLEKGFHVPVFVRNKDKAIGAFIPPLGGLTFFALKKLLAFRNSLNPGTPILSGSYKKAVLTEAVDDTVTIINNMKTQFPYILI